jgi:hypothetical protein
MRANVMNLPREIDKKYARLASYNVEEIPNHEIPNPKKIPNSETPKNTAPALVRRRIL